MRKNAFSLLVVGTVYGCLNLATSHQVQAVPLALSPQTGHPSNGLLTADTAGNSIAASLSDIEALQWALDILNTVDGSLMKSLMAVDIAIALDRLDERERALALLEKTRESTTIIEQPEDRATVLNAVANAYGQLQETEIALVVLDQTLDIIDTIDIITNRDQGSKTSSLTHAAKTYIQLGETESALNLLNQSLETVDAIDPPRTAFFRLLDIGRTYGQLDQTDQALVVLGQALTRADQIERTQDQCRALADVAIAYDQLDQGERAQTILEEALIMVEAFSPPAGDFRDFRGDHAYDVYNFDAYALHVIVQAASQLQDRPKGLAVLEKSQAVANSMDDAGSIFRAWHSIAVGYEQLGETGQALAALAKALSVVGTVDHDVLTQADGLSDIALVYERLGKREQALTLFDRASQVAGKIDFLEGKVDVLSDIARGYKQLGQPEKSMAVLERAEEDIAVMAVRDSSAEFNGWKTIVAAYIQLGYEEQAQRILETLLADLDTVEKDWVKVFVLNNVASSAGELQDREKALGILADVYVGYGSLGEENRNSLTMLFMVNALMELVDSARVPVLVD
ncbi:tetratricopeptide repeat protein [Leptothoe spongobia]|uniref:MalT-like TPR region domain-containing protein n=1 Tax=Leptothoe spongobia TAU-MAC 1115 TaxID=1967444 RepID=A0A947DEX3_9CYAN|nr:hypothetical protein [Leptothoe spongobia]MBT9314646.1 hypothetical protein [Leptothoe spongobia TAU-MAC 1115]